MNNQKTQSQRAKYKVRNWKEYNASLCKRGSLMLFISPEILDEWSEISQKKKQSASKPIQIQLSNAVFW